MLLKAQRAKVKSITVEADDAIDTARQLENLSRKSTILNTEIALKKCSAELAQLDDDDRKCSDEHREREAHKCEWRLRKEHETHRKERWISSTAATDDSYDTDWASPRSPPRRRSERSPLQPVRCEPEPSKADAKPAKLSFLVDKS
jgi:hypothetical protein